MANKDINVLVTGGSGYLGSYIILKLLNEGYTVRTTIRNIKRKDDVIAMLKEGGAVDPENRLSFYVAELTKDEGWAEAVKGCTYVLHVASPFHIEEPKNPDDMLIPAREGTLRVLKVSRDAGVKRVVQTSSFAAIGYGHPETTVPVDETSWTNPEGKEVSTYILSKYVTEKAAWDFIKKEGGDLQLSVVNPVGIFGPVLSVDFAASVEIIKRLMDGGVPATPNLTFGIVDVRDTADLHLLAMTKPEAAGERFLGASGKSWTMNEVAQLLRSRFPEKASKIPSRHAPSWLIRIMSLFSVDARTLAPLLDKDYPVTSEKAIRVLGWKPRPAEETIVDTASSLIKFGVV